MHGPKSFGQMPTPRRAKLETQFGPFNIKSIIGREKAVKNSATYTGGTTSDDWIIDV